MVASFLFGEFLLHIPCWLNFYLDSFSYTSRTGFIFLWGVSLTHPVLASFFFFFFNLWSFSYTSHTCFIFLWGVSFTHPMLAFSSSSSSFNLGSFSYTSRASFILTWGISLTHPVLASFFFFFFLFFFWGLSLTYPVPALFLSGEFLLHSPCLFYFAVGRFSYTSHAHTVLFFLGGGGGVVCFVFVFLNLGSSSSTSHAGFIFIWGVSLTHPVLASFLFGEFLLHIPCWFHFYLASFSYTSHAPASFSYTSHAAFFFFFFFFFFLNLGSFSYTSRAGFIFIWGVSLTHPVLASFLFGEFLLHIPCWFHFYLASFSYTSHAPASFSYTSHAAFFFFF